jgi:hypothetical protein
MRCACCLCAPGCSDRASIHGTSQPEFIGQAISSGCIRMTNEDVIDLFDRVKPDATVVVLPPDQGGWTGAFAGFRS